MTGMRESIEAARRGVERTSDLATAAAGARERVESYREEGEGTGVTSFGRMRELEQERDLAETRLRRAQAGGDRRRPAGEPAATSDEDAPMPVSYTHLTLPTKRIV